MFIKFSCGLQQKSSLEITTKTTVVKNIKIMKLAETSEFERPSIGSTNIDTYVSETSIPVLDTSISAFSPISDTDMKTSTFKSTYSISGIRTPTPSPGPESRVNPSIFSPEPDSDCGISTSGGNAKIDSSSTTISSEP